MTPILHGDGKHNDAAALQAILEGRPYRDASTGRMENSSMTYVNHAEKTATRVRDNMSRIIELTRALEWFDNCGGLNPGDIGVSLEANKPVNTTGLHEAFTLVERYISDQYLGIHDDVAHRARIELQALKQLYPSIDFGG